MFVVYHVILAVSGLSNHTAGKHPGKLIPQSKFPTLIWAWDLMKWHLSSLAVFKGQCLFLVLWLSCKDIDIWDRKEATLPQSVNVWATGKAVRDCEEEVNGMHLILGAWDLTGLNYGFWHWEVHISNGAIYESFGATQNQPLSEWWREVQGYSARAEKVSSDMWTLLRGLLSREWPPIRAQISQVKQTEDSNCHKKS